jgi:hypothetical protein
MFCTNPDVYEDCMFVSERYKNVKDLRRVNVLSYQL